MNRKFNVERSREIRQWISLGMKAIGSFVTIDYLANGGNWTTKLIQQSKDKVEEFKEKIQRKKESA